MVFIYLLLYENMDDLWKSFSKVGLNCFLHSYPPVTVAYLSGFFFFLSQLKVDWKLQESIFSYISVWLLCMAYLCRYNIMTWFSLYPSMTAICCRNLLASSTQVRSPLSLRGHWAHLIIDKEVIQWGSRWGAPGLIAFQGLFMIHIWCHFWEASCSFFPSKPLQVGSRCSRIAIPRWSQIAYFPHFSSKSQAVNQKLLLLSPLSYQWDNGKGLGRNREALAVEKLWLEHIIL